MNLPIKLITGNKNIYWVLTALLSSAVLYLIWPMAHMTALQKLLLVISAYVGFMLWFRGEDRYAILKTPWLLFMGLLLAWVFFHAAYISQNGDEAWRAFSGQWVPGYVAIMAGIGLAVASRSVEPSTFKIYLLAVLAAQPVLYLYLSVSKSVELGYLAISYFELYDITMGTDLKTSLTFSSDMLCALGCVMFLESFKSDTVKRERYIWLLPIALGVCVAIFSTSLSSQLLVSACIALMLALLALRLKIKNFRSIIAAVIVLVGISIYTASLIPAVALKWERMFSNLKVAVNIDKDINWRNLGKLGLPKNEFGETVPESFYLRVAYAQAGLRAVIENPWGYGVTRKAFERLAQKKYPDVSISSAHNGYLDLSSSVGIPGLLLFVLALISIFRQLNKSNSEWAHPAVWMIGIYVVHWFVDSIERDNFFTSYLFVIALLLTLDNISHLKKTVNDSPTQKKQTNEIGRHN